MEFSDAVHAVRRCAISRPHSVDPTLCTLCTLCTSLREEVHLHSVHTVRRAHTARRCAKHAHAQRARAHSGYGIGK